MSTEPARGHVPDLNLGRYRMLKRAENGALAAAHELGQLGDAESSLQAFGMARKLRAAAHELRVVIDDARGS